MPFLRVLRDKRGYETTYLIHWFRDGQRQRSKILYAFRTPPGVRVGCRPFDASVMRDLQAAYPDIEFDWRALIDTQQVVEANPEPRRPRKRRRGDDEPGEQPAAAAPAAAPESASPPAASVVKPAVPRWTPPAAIEGETTEGRVEWLRRWYPQIREHIPHRTHDPARLEALFALAERLNPDAWGDAAAIEQGLAHAAEALLRLSHVFAKRRRRTRRGPRRTPGTDTPPAADAS